MPKRKSRGHGEGTIRKKCKKCTRSMLNERGHELHVCEHCGHKHGRWEATITLSTTRTTDPDTGMVKVHQKRKTVYGDSRASVIAELQEMQGDIRGGTLAEPGKLMVGDYLSAWLDEVAAHMVKPVTLESYRIMLRVHALPMLGDVKLKDLTPAHIQRLYSERLKAGKSRRTVQYVHSVLRRAFDQAVRQGKLARNPCDQVDAPRPQRHEFAVLTPDQAQRLMQVLPQDRLGALYHLALVTGMRRGELVALRWQDVDLQKGTVTVARTAERVQRPGQRYTVEFTEPKTAKSRRQIPLPADAVAALRRHKERQAFEQRQRRKEGQFEDHGLVWCYDDGRPYNPGGLSQLFAAFLKRNGLPHVRLHDLRHSHATLLMAAGVHPKVVAERLGHSTTTLTLDTYSHVLPGMQEKVAELLGAILNPARPKGS